MFENTWTNVSICPDFGIFTAGCTWCTNWVSLTQFWHDVVKTWSLNFKIFRKRFINEYLTWKILLPLLVIFLSTLVPISIIFNYFWVETSPRGLKTIKYFTSNVPLLVTFIFVSPLVDEIQVWALFDSEIYWENDPTNSILQSSMKYWFWSFYHPRYMIFNFQSVLPNLEIMTSQKK